MKRAKQPSKLKRALTLEPGSIPGDSNTFWPAIQISHEGEAALFVVAPEKSEETGMQAAVMASMDKEKAFEAIKEREPNVAPFVACMAELQRLGYINRQVLLASPTAVALKSLVQTTLRELVKIPPDGFTVGFTTEGEIKVELQGSHDHAYNRSMVEVIGKAMLRWIEEAQEAEHADGAQGDQQRFLYHLVEELNAAGLDLEEAGIYDS